MRILQLQTSIRWPWLESAASILFVTQIAAALHYLPLSPLASGVIILGALFSVVNFIISISQEIHLGRALIESSVPFVLSIVLGLLVN
jgi:hypothetical protein